MSLKLVAIAFISLLTEETIVCDVVGIDPVTPLRTLGKDVTWFLVSRYGSMNLAWHHHILLW